MFFFLKALKTTVYEVRAHAGRLSNPKLNIINVASHPRLKDVDNQAERLCLDRYRNEKVEKHGGL